MVSRAIYIYQEETGSVSIIVRLEQLAKCLWFHYKSLLKAFNQILILYNVKGLKHIFDNARLKIQNNKNTIKFRAIVVHLFNLILTSC